MGPEEINNACAKTACTGMMDTNFAVIYSGMQIHMFCSKSKIKHSTCKIHFINVATSEYFRVA